MNKKIIPKKIMRGMKFFNVPDLTEILGLAPLAVRDYLRKGKIKAVKIGKRWWVSDKNLNAFLNAGAIFDKPDKVILDTISEGVKNIIEEREEKLKKELTEVFLKQLSEKYTITKKQ